MMKLHIMKSSWSQHMGQQQRYDHLAFLLTKATSASVAAPSIASLNCVRVHHDYLHCHTIGIAAG
jgi:hypothetical protein